MKIIIIAMLACILAACAPAIVASAIGGLFVGGVLVSRHTHDNEYRYHYGDRYYHNHDFDYEDTFTCIEFKHVKKCEVNINDETK